MRIRADVRSTFRPEVLGDIGGFGGLFALGDRFRDPVLVSTTDGVGTKAMVATMAGRYGTIGIDLVAMCVDDLVCQGAEPLFFLDYISIGRLDSERGRATRGRRGRRVSPGRLRPHRRRDGRTPRGHGTGGVRPGGLRRRRGREVRHSSTDRRSLPATHSSGCPLRDLRSNGYSLARHVLFERAGLGLDAPAWTRKGRPTSPTSCSRPSVIYAPAVRSLQGEPRGALRGPRDRRRPRRESRTHDPRRPPTQRSIGPPGSGPGSSTGSEELGDVSTDEMEKVFNLGIGMVIAVPDDQAVRCIESLERFGPRRPPDRTGRRRFGQHVLLHG